MGGRAKADREAPERTCAVTGLKGPPEAMIPFCLSPDGAVVPDIRRKLPGRGVWVSARSVIVDQAARRQVFSRGFKAKAQAPADLAATVYHCLGIDPAMELTDKLGRNNQVKYYRIAMGLT